jgi:hypothetical protein
MHSRALAAQPFKFMAGAIITAGTTAGVIVTGAIVVAGVTVTGPRCLLLIFRKEAALVWRLFVYARKRPRAESNGAANLLGLLPVPVGLGMVPEV